MITFATLRLLAVAAALATAVTALHLGITAT